MENPTSVTDDGADRLCRFAHIGELPRQSSSKMLALIVGEPAVSCRFLDVLAVSVAAVNRKGRAAPAEVSLAEYVVACPTHAARSCFEHDTPNGYKSIFFAIPNSENQPSAGFPQLTSR
jgi:hypothetical protein